MERLVKKEGIEYNVTIGDLEELIREERKYRYYIHSFHWHSQEWSPEIYHNLEEIEDRLASLLSQHPNLLSRQHLGVTAQGRNIDAIVVKKDNLRTKPVIWLDCGIHAREWVSPPACLHAIHTLVQDSNSVDPRADLLQAFDFTSFLWQTQTATSTAGLTTECGGRTGPEELLSPTIAPELIPTGISMPILLPRPSSSAKRATEGATHSRRPSLGRSRKVSS